MKHGVSIIALLFPLLLAGQAHGAQSRDSETAADGGIAAVRTSPSGVTYATGGVGRESVDRMEQLAKGRDFNVKMTFAWDTGNYLANIPVTIEDSSGRKVLELASSDPILLVNLPKGQYTATATYKGKSEKRTIQVGDGGPQTVRFSWQQPKG